MTKKWNLQDIHPNEPRRKRSDQRSSMEVTRGDMRRRMSVEEPMEPERTVPNKVPRSPRRRIGSGGKRRLIKIGAIVLGLVAIAFIGSMFLSGAQVAIYPKHKNVTVQANFTAHTEPAAGELGYELLTLEADAERQVNASGKEQTSQQATGHITIYNEYSDKSIRLVKNTRFESPDGLIFKITESAVVPGYTTDDAGNITPGTVVADVFADGTGDSYNIDPTSFTVPGFKGDPEYDKVYGKSSEAFTGGFEGERYIIDGKDLQTATDALHGELKDALRAKLDSERPAGFVVYNNAVTFKFDSLPSTEGGGDVATLKEHGTLQVPMFKEDAFAGYIAKNTVAGYEDGPVTLTDPSSLTFAYASSTVADGDVSALTEIPFTLSGNTELVWTFDQDKLKNDLAGLSKSALPTVLSGYTAIEKAEATIRPFWKQSFPSDPDKIKLNITIQPKG